MRFMVLIKADRNTEAGVMPSEQLLAEMGRFNEALVQAGVMVSGEGLHPSAKGARMRFSGSERTVLDGPFADTGGLVAGFWVWQVASKQEAIAWLRRCPNPMDGADAEIELRQIFEAEDFGAEFTPELRAQEERLRAELAAPRVSAVPPVKGATPYLVVKGAADAIAHYQAVFGAELLTRLDMPDGSVMHAELKIGPAHFMLTEERPQHNALGPLRRGGSSVSLAIYVPDADAVVQRAVDAGASIGMPVANQFWGDRSGMVIDPFGHQWFVGTHTEDVSGEEMQRRLRAMLPDCG